MKLYNYAKMFGAFIDAMQPITLAVEPKDRQERKMLEEAQSLINSSWVRREEFLKKQMDSGSEAGAAIDIEAERKAFMPTVADGNITISLQFLQDYMVRKIAAIQNNMSIHNLKEVRELQEVFDDYGVTSVKKLENLTFDFVNWTAKGAQKPKVLVHAKDADGVAVCVRLEAATELSQKFLNAAMALGLKAGDTFSIEVDAVDPAPERNKRLGKEASPVGKYVNHNIVVRANGKEHSGHPPKGERFQQKPTMEYLERLCMQVQRASSRPQ